MAIKIGVIKNKGGVGASSGINSLAGELSTRVNQKTKKLNRVLLIDTDQQNNLKTLYQVKSTAEGGLSAILTEGIAPQALTIKVRENVHLITSGGRLIKDIEPMFSQTPNAEYLMKTRFKDIENSYDYILVDSAPSITLLTTQILNYCDYVITFSTLDLLGLVGCKNILQFYELTKKHFPDLAKFLAIIPSLCDFRRRVDTDLYHDLISLKENDLTQGAIITSPFHSDSKMRTSQVRRKLIQEAFPTSKSANDIKLIANELEEEILKKSSSVKKIEHKRDLEAGL